MKISTLDWQLASLTRVVVLVEVIDGGEEHRCAARRDPAGLDPCLSQHKNDRALVAVPSLFKKNASLPWKRHIYKIFPSLVLRPPF